MKNIEEIKNEMYKIAMSNSYQYATDQKIEAAKVYALLVYAGKESANNEKINR